MWQDKLNEIKNLKEIPAATNVDSLRFYQAVVTEQEIKGVDFVIHEVGKTPPILIVFQMRFKTT